MYEYTKDDSVDEVFDERGNVILAMRMIGWGGKEPRLELRKWNISIEKETPNKGFAFLTEEGPHNLVSCLLKAGYGKTDEVLNSIKDREDFKEALVKTLGSKEAIKELGIEEDYYDPKESLF